MPQIEFNATHDAKWIAGLMSRPEIAESSFPDGIDALTLEQIEAALRSEKMNFIQIVVDGVAIGFFLLELKFPFMEIHTVISAEHRGKDAFSAARKFTGWCFDQYELCDELMTQVPTFNRQAALFAVRAGLKKSEKLGSAFTKHGRTEHMNIYIMNRST